MIEIRIENPRAATQLPKRTIQSGGGVRLRAGRRNQAPIMVGSSRKATFYPKQSFRLLPDCMIEINISDLSKVFIRGRRGDSIRVEGEA